MNYEIDLAGILHTHQNCKTLFPKKDIFGLLQREGKDESGNLKSYPCLISNKKGGICGQMCDPFGHGAFVCKATNRTSDHNHCRDILDSMGQAFRFITSTEVVISPWQKKPDVQLVDPSGELLTILLDVTLPALFQDSAGSREEVYNGARKAKANAYPHKDSEGRRINPSPCLPFILTSMGGLCSEGHEFIRLCRSREQAAADHMIDVLVTQHSRWTARRFHRALFGQSLIDFGGDSWSCVSSQAGKAKISNRCRGKKCAMQTCILSKFSRQFTSSREAVGTTEVFAKEEESPIQYVSSDNDS